MSVDFLQMSATIYEVAHLAGVSTATVSHVINGTRFVSEDLRKKVRDAMDELDYRPNMLARNLRSGKSKVIGVLLPDCTNLFFAEIARSIDRMCFSLGYNIILCNTDNNLSHQSNYTDMLLSKHVDGIIFICSDKAVSDVSKCVSSHIPAVVVDRDMNCDFSDSIVVNNEQGSFEATSYLIEMGFQNIAFISGPKGISSADERAAGFRRALKTNKIDYRQEFTFHGDFHYSGGRQAFLHFRTLPEKPDAVFAANDMMAIGFIHTAKENNVRIPHDISVVGFDDIELSSIIIPPLTTIAQPIEEIAEIATRRLLEKIELQKTDIRKIVLEPHLIIRESSRKL